MEDDSGYFSHRSHYFRLPGAHLGGSCRLPYSSSSSSSTASSNDIFHLSFDDLRSPNNHHYLRFGFTDEDDFEEFKRELIEFRLLKRAARAGGGLSLPEDESSPGSGGQRGERRTGLLVSNGTVFDTAALPARRGSGGRDNGVDRVWRAGGGGGTEGDGVDLSGSEGSGRRESRRWSGECHATSPLASGISYREGSAGSVSSSGSGGARAKDVGNRRNGVYFDDDCVVNDPRRGGCDQRGPEGADRDRWGRGSGSSFASDHSVCSGKSGERRSSASGNGSRRVSFRETPERFTIGDGILQSSTDLETFSGDSSEDEEELNASYSENEIQTPSSLKQKSESGQYLKGSDFAGEFVSRNTQSPVRRTVPGVDDQSFSAESWRDVCGGRASADRKRSSVGGEADSGRRSQPVEIPIRLVSEPVSRLDSSRAPDARSLSLDDDRLLDSHVNLGERGDSKKCSARPPRDPTFSTEKRPGKDRSGAGQDPALNILRKLADRQNSDPLPTPQSRAGQDSRSHPGESGDPRHSQTYHHPKRSSLLESLRRLSGHGRPRSGRGTDPWMDLFGGDEPFQEFERVFETINSHRLSRDLDMRRPGGWWTDDLSEKDPGDANDLGILHIDEDFLDFFDHDEDFMEFERELENINSNRRSKLLENLHRRSSCDIFEDVKSFCDRNVKRNSTPTSSPKVERRLSATHSGDKDLWNSAEEWDLVLNKLRRNSRLLSDQALNSADGGRVGGLEDCGRTVEEVTRNRTLPASFMNRTARSSHLCPGPKDCQYTCHLSCVPAVTLDCTTVSPGSGEGPVATPTDLPSPTFDLPSPSASAETSLIERRTIVNHRSPQKQPASTPSSSTNSPSAVRNVSQNVQHLTPPSSTCARSSSSPTVSSIRDPLSGVCVSMATSLSSTPGASSACVEKDLNQNAKNIANGFLTEHRMGDDICDASNEKDETDSGYRSGTIPEEKLPKAPSQATLNRMELRRKIQTFNHFVPGAALQQKEDGESFQGFLRVTLNLIRPITMELGARPPSIYELLTREHIVEQSTQHVAFYMPRDTVKSIHISSKTTTKEVISNLLKKFHILDHPRKFAMYEQEFNEKNKLVKLRRLTDKDCPLVALLSWKPEQVKHYRLVLQENETGEIVWENFSQPELKNFQIVLDREESEAIAQLQYKYRAMKRIILQRMKELRQEKHAAKESTA
ncbi:hypothetical protein ACOMHN_051671 [Nucella lapillus]